MIALPFLFMQLNKSWPHPTAKCSAGLTGLAGRAEHRSKRNERKQRKAIRIEGTTNKKGANEN